MLVIGSIMQSYAYAYNTSTWHRFWWWTPGQRWPSNAIDVLKDAYGTCKSDDLYCFQRLPSWAEEDSTELLAIDAEGTVYQWKFDSKNPTRRTCRLASSSWPPRNHKRPNCKQQSLESRNTGRKQTQSDSRLFHVPQTKWSEILSSGR